MDEDGSTGSTATLFLSAIAALPRHSMRLDLPAPGGPQTPIRNDILVSWPFFRLASWSSRSLATSLSRGCLLSTSVTQRERTPRSHRSSPSSRCCMASRAGMQWLAKELASCQRMQRMARREEESQFDRQSSVELGGTRSGDTCSTHDLRSERGAEVKLFIKDSECFESFLVLCMKCPLIYHYSLLHYNLLLRLHIDQLDTVGRVSVFRVSQYHSLALNP